MNSPFYIGVVIHPDKTADKCVDVVYSGEDYAAASGQARRSWAESQAAWNELPQKNEPPFHDVYVCIRRLDNMTPAQKEDVESASNMYLNSI